MESTLIIDNAISKLFINLKQLDFQAAAISAYNKNYLLKYINNYDFYMGLYKQLLEKAIDKLHKPVAESVFVDYGGGCGILSYLAKEIGFKTVVYNDIYPVSVADVKVISNLLNVCIDYFISGDITEFINEINSNKILPDLICSFDVLEHIYDWKFWIKETTRIENLFSILFMTSANTNNPVIKKRLKKLQLQAEYKSYPKDKGWKESDLDTSFLEERKKIITAKFADLKIDDINMLAKQSRGLIKTDIEQLVLNYVQTGAINYKPGHPTNTCDPYTGSWTENLINIKQLENFARNNCFSVEITNAYYSYSKNKLLNLPKYFMNVFIRILGNKNLFFSPVYVLEMQKEKFN